MYIKNENLSNYYLQKILKLTRQIQVQGKIMENNHINQWQIENKLGTIILRQNSIQHKKKVIRDRDEQLLFREKIDQEELTLFC